MKPWQFVTGTRARTFVDNPRPLCMLTNRQPCTTLFLGLAGHTLLQLGATQMLAGRGGTILSLRGSSRREWNSSGQGVHDDL